MGDIVIKVLLIENNKMKCKEIINGIANNNLNIRIYSIAYTGKEAINLIREQKVDLILMDTDIPDIKCDKILKVMTTENIEKYKNSIILLTNFSEKQKIDNYLNNEYIYDCLFDKIDIDIINKLLRKFYYQKDKDIIINKVHNELEKLHFKFSYNGTKYLIECIYEIYIRSDKYGINLSKDIFPVIARKNNTSINTIHCNIKQSVNSMYYDCDERILNEYFKSYEAEKPKLKELIIRIVDKLVEQND